MAAYGDIHRITTGEGLVVWFCEVYPSSPSMAAEVCLYAELGRPLTLIEGCPIAGHLHASAQWREYLLGAVLDYHGRLNVTGVNYTLTDLFLWRFTASRHPEWVPEWTPEWENVYAHEYNRMKEAHNGATADQSSPTQTRQATRSAWAPGDCT